MITLICLTIGLSVFKAITNHTSQQGRQQPATEAEEKIPENSTRSEGQSGPERAEKLSTSNEDTLAEEKQQPTEAKDAKDVKIEELTRELEAAKQQLQENKQET